jgi:hypothetical protein
MHASSDSDASFTGVENAARAALETRAERTLTDAEWAAVRATLQEFAGIVRAWDRRTKKSAPELGNV